MKKKTLGFSQGFSALYIIEHIVQMPTRYDIPNI